MLLENRGLTVRLLLRSFLIFVFTIPPSRLVTAYPNWMKCYIPLENTERVMGADIIAFDDTRYRLHVEIKGPEDLTWSHYSNFEYTGPTTVKARLKVPEAMQEYNIMFLMESTKGATLDPPMCNGVRSFARTWNSEITVKIDGTQDRIELWAGWARAFEPVKLTKRIVLRKKGTVTGDIDLVDEDGDEDDEDYYEDGYDEEIEDDVDDEEYDEDEDDEVHDEGDFEDEDDEEDEDRDTDNEL